MRLSEPEMGAQTKNQFSQKQYAPIWHAAFGLLVTSSLGISYGAAASAIWGLTTGIISSSLVIYWWLSKAILISVSADWVKVGKLNIERKYIGEVLSLTAPEFLERIRGGAHRQDVFVLRNLNAGGVVIEIKDNRDPFCHWVISCKSASKLASALTDY